MNISDVSRRWRTRTASAQSVSTAVERVQVEEEQKVVEEPVKTQSKPVAKSPVPVEPAVPGPNSAHARRNLKKNQRRSLEELQRVWQRLAVNILASNAGRVPWTMGIGSAIRGEGRTTSAMGIAYAVARETGEKVALLELDLENPSLSEEIQAGSTPGLIQHLQDECGFEDTFRETAGGQITLIPGSSGWKQSAFKPSLDDLAVRLRHLIPEFMDTLKSQFKYTIVDLPPVLSNMQAERMAISLNGTLMVVRSGVTPINLIEESVDLMGDENLLGVIQVGPPSPVPAWLSNLLAG